VIPQIVALQLDQVKRDEGDVMVNVCCVGAVADPITQRRLFS
jgi:hypothetical protein